MIFSSMYKLLIDSSDERCILSSKAGGSKLCRNIEGSATTLKLQRCGNEEDIVQVNVSNPLV